MMKDTEFKPDTAYLLQGTWEDIIAQLVERKDQSLTIKLRVTPGLFDHVRKWASGIKLAIESGYIEMNARLIDGREIYLSAAVEEGYRGDEDGFGMEPDEYLVGTVAPDGTFTSPLRML